MIILTNSQRPQLAEPIVTPCERVQKDDSTSYYVLPQKLAKRRASGMDSMYRVVNFHVLSIYFILCWTHVIL